MMERLETERIGMLPSTFSRLLTSLSSLLAPVRIYTYVRIHTYICMYTCVCIRVREHLAILHHPGTLLALSLSLMLVYRSRNLPSVARDTRLVMRAYDVTRTDRRYLAAWTFSNGQIHAASSICEGTRNCPAVSVITCWRSSQVPATHWKKKIDTRTDCVRFQRNIDFTPVRAIYFN